MKLLYKKGEKYMEFNFGNKYLNNTNEKNTEFPLKNTNFFKS